MKEVFYNHDNLKDNEIDESAVRTKALIINDNNQIILGYDRGTYQFPGGHVNSNESLEMALKRELKEELGISFIEKIPKPFMMIKSYRKNYRNTNKNRENIIYYYLINTNLKVDYNNLSLTNWEKKGNYEIKVINMSGVDNLLLNSIDDNSINRLVVEEMLDVLKEYRKICV